MTRPRLKSGVAIRVAVPALAMLAPLAAPALADQAAVRRGAAIVEEWCRDCHVHEGQKLTADMAPPYSMIVSIEGRDRAWFETFLREDHFPMTTFRLFDHEKADVVEWLMDLQKRVKE